MSKHLGIRVEPSAVHYAVIEIENGDVNIETTASIKIPKSQSTGTGLAHVRTQVQSVISDFNVESVGIKVAENNAQKISRARSHIEGVIIEASHSSNVPSSIETKVTMAPKMNLQRNEMSNIIAGNKPPFDIEGWKSLNEKNKEAILAAYASSRK